ncbi:MAG: protein-disulfide reductase DsbD domain-containing protein, partial [Candidatus Eiseniibacteriota bacterium]
CGDRLVGVIRFGGIHREARSYAGPGPRGHRAFTALLAAFVLLSAAGPRAARGGSTGQSENTTVTLVAEPASVQPGRPFYVGLRMRMKQGWHTYWKNPGDSGLPTSVEWTLPKGFIAGAIEWPAPERMPLGPEMSYGYPGEVLLAVLVTPPKTIEASSITIAGKVRWLECSNVCLPGSASLELSLPVTHEEPAPGPDAAAFATTRSRLAREGAAWNLTAIAGPRVIALDFRPPSGIVPGGAYLFVDQPLVVDYAALQPWGRAGDGFRLTATPAANATSAPGALTGVLVVQDANAKGVSIPVRVDIPVVAGDPGPMQPAATEAPPSEDWLGGVAKTAIAAAIFLYAAWAWTGSKRPPADPRTNGGPSGVV